MVLAYVKLIRSTKKPLLLVLVDVYSQGHDWETGLLRRNVRKTAGGLTDRMTIMTKNLKTFIYVSCELLDIKLSLPFEKNDKVRQCYYITTDSLATSQRTTKRIAECMNAKETAPIRAVLQPPLPPL